MSDFLLVRQTSSVNPQVDPAMERYRIIESGLEGARSGALSPLLILEFVKEANKEHRWIRIASSTGAALNETPWLCWCSAGARNSATVNAKA
jgi:hypothetical protein